MATFNVVMRQLREGQNCFSKCFSNNYGYINKTLGNSPLQKDTVRCLGVFPQNIDSYSVLPASLKFTGIRHFHFHNLKKNDNNLYKIGPTSLKYHKQKIILFDLTGSDLQTAFLQQESKISFATAKFSTNTEKVNSSSEIKNQNVENISSNYVNYDSSKKSTTAEQEPAKEEKKEKKKESWFTGKNQWKLGLLLMGGSVVTWGSLLISSWGSPLLDPDGNPIDDEYTGQSFEYLKRTWKEMNIFQKSIADPSREKLLPDPLQYPYMQPPYTLVVELKDVLIHPDWTYNTGWRFKKRPALDYFLTQVGPPLFEVVIYSSEAGMTLDPIVSQLDPQGFIMYRLYRDATRYMDSHHVKDLSCLNRDESRIIMIDADEQSVKLQPKNALVLKKWTGSDEDRTLVDLAHFLKTIAASGVEDVRTVLEYYHNFEDPLEAFKENQRKFQEEQDARAQQTAEESKKKSWFSGLGVKR